MTHTVTLFSTSRAGDAGYLAARDLTLMAGALDVPYRLVGGLAVTILASVHGVGARVAARETADADFAAAPEVLADPRLVPSLTGMGYRQVEGNRFERLVDRDGPLTLTVDLLAPAYVASLQPNQRLGDLVVDAVPGLGLALAMPATEVELSAELLGGDVLTMRVKVPDVSAALCTKALAWQGRRAERDVVDLHRLLEAASAAGVRAADWPLHGVRLDAARILHGELARSSRRDTRIRALVMDVVARPA